MRVHWAKLGAALFLSIALPNAAQAQTQQQHDWCYANDATADQTIEGCTALIGSTGLSTADLATVYSDRGIGYGQKGDYNHAIADYNEAIRLNPNNPDFYYHRGNAFDDKQDYGRAILDFNEAIRLDPKYVAALNNRGNDYRRKHDFDRAIADYNEAIVQYPDFEYGYNNRGEAYLLKEEYDRALADFKHAIQLDAKEASPLYGRGIVELRSGNTAEGQKDIAAAKKLQPDIADVYARDGIKP